MVHLATLYLTIACNLYTNLAEKAVCNLYTNAATTTASPSSNPNSTSSPIQSKVANIGNLLDEAVSVRISKYLLDNPKTQALVLANLGNEIYSNYGNALGLPPNTVATMAGMSMQGMMPGKGPSILQMSSGNAMSGMNGMNQSPATIKNMTAYQTAQSISTIPQ